MRCHKQIITILKYSFNASGIFVLWLCLLFNKVDSVRLYLCGKQPDDAIYFSKK